VKHRFPVKPVLAGLLALAVCAVVLALVLSDSSSDAGSASTPAASGGGKTIPHLNVGLQYSIPSLDGSKSASAYQVFGLSLDHVERVNPEGQLENQLAEKIEQTSPTEYLYTLRPGVRFWNGQELTAEDLVFSWNLYRQPTSIDAQYFHSVKHIEAVDRRTVKVTLKKPDAAWRQQSTSAPGIFEKAFYEQHKRDFGKPGTLIMGTGPWKWDSLDSSGAELAANPDYWGGPVNVDRISLKFYADETSEALAFRAGDLDVAFPSDGRAFGSTAGVKLTASTPTNGPLVLALDTIAAPWNDVHVRRAVAYALNREDIIKAYGVDAAPLDTLIPPSQLSTLGSRAEVNALLDSLPKYPYDLEKARQEMAQSRYPNGTKAEFNTLAGYGFRDMAQVIKQQLARIGIDLEIRIVEQNRWLALITGADRAKIGIQLTTPLGRTADPSELPERVLGSVNAAAGQFNLSNWAPADVDRLIADSSRTSDRAKRLELYGQILRRVAEEVPYVPIVQVPVNLALSKDLTWPTFSFPWETNAWPLEIRPR
jgi:peptide/nickel transport system substrate-binding protein